MVTKGMFWKRFYFVVVLLSCNCFLLCASWSFCEKLKNFFCCGSSETEDNTVSGLNIPDNANNYKNQLSNQYEENTFINENLNNNYNYNENIFNIENCGINDFDNQYNNLEGVDFSTLELLEGQKEPSGHNFSCAFCSACAVGKTSIRNRAINESFKENCESTLGINFTSFFLKTTNNLIIGLEVWDMASGNVYQSFSENICKQRNATILFYDITNKESLGEDLVIFINNVKKKCNENNNNNNHLFFLLGNKLDLKEGRQVKTEEAKTFAEKNNLIFLGECSARDNQYMPATENTCYKEKKMKEGKYCTDGVTGIFKDILYNIVNKQKSQGE